MRVLMLAQAFEPAKGGGPRWTTELAHGLAKRGHDVLVLTREYAGITGSVRPRDGLEVQYLRIPILRGCPIYSPRLIKERVNRFRPDIIQTSSPSVPDVLMPRPRRYGVPYATLFHAQLGASLPAHLVQWINLIRLRQDWAAIAVTSSYWRDWLVARGISKERVRIIPSTVSQRFADGPLAGTTRTAPEALFVGGLDSMQSYKRFDLLIEAAKLLKRNHPTFQWHLNVVGDGNLLQAFQASATAAELNGIVTFLGRASDEMLHRLYSTAGLVVLPSSDAREGWGLVLAEALCCGAPILFTDGIGGARTFAAAPGAMVVRKNDADALGEGVRAILSAAPDGRDAARIAFGRQFHATAVVEQYESLYAEAIAR